MVDLQLRNAAKSSNFGRVRKLVQSGVNINARNRDGTTLLHDITMDGNVAMIEHLVGLGADVNAADIGKKTSLHCLLLADKQLAKKAKKEHSRRTKGAESFKRMIEQKKIEIIKTLCRLGADVNAKFDHVSVLHGAVRSGDVPVIKRLIQCGLCSKYVNNDGCIGCTALIMSIVKREMAIMECLVQLGADLRATHCISCPIHDAIEMGRLDIVKLLVKNGADVNVIQKYAVPPLFQEYLRIRYESKIDVAMLDRLICMGADPNVSSSAKTAVHLAVEKHHVAIVTYLLSHGGDLSVNKVTQTILGLAASDGGTDVTECLMKHGADVNIQYDYRVPILLDAVRQGNEDMVEVLVQNAVDLEDGVFRDWSALWVAVLSCEVEPVKVLLKHGADVNTKCGNLGSVVFDCVERGDMRMVHVLSKLGADMNNTRMEGRTILHGAFDIYKEFSGDDGLEMIKTLISAGVDLNAGFSEGVSMVHVAARLSDTEMVKSLVHLGSDINLGYSESVRILHMLSKTHIHDNPQRLVECLAQHGANMDVETKIRVTPLHDAVNEQNFDMVECLIEEGADITLGLFSGVRPIYFTNHDIDMVKCLVQNGADINVTTTRNVTALHIAWKKKDLEMMKLLFKMGMRGNFQTEHKCSLLTDALQEYNAETFEYLLSQGIDKSGNCNIPVTLHAHGECNSEVFWEDSLSLNQSLGYSPLHWACKTGDLDNVRLLLISGSDANSLNHLGKKPMECFPLRDVVNCDVLFQVGIEQRITENISFDALPDVVCQNMKSLLSSPGIGNVNNIEPTKLCITGAVCSVLKMYQDACSKMAWSTLKLCGSAGEGTKVGLPTEMDLLFQFDVELDGEKQVQDAGSGFCHVVSSGCELLEGGSKKFHQSFSDKIYELMKPLVGSTGNSLETFRHKSSDICYYILDADRKACVNYHTGLYMMEGDQSSYVEISVDLVPCVHVSGWPKGGIKNTWLMDHTELKRWGFNLVPKPPHATSTLAMNFKKEELSILWRMSFSRLETEHMQRLEQKIKDVYIMAKLLRNPDLCRFMVADEGSWPRGIDRYITSYLLKMVFFMNVEHFRSSDMSLGEMVCKLYDDLEHSFSKGHIPMYFMPQVNVLDGLKLDVRKCAEVAQIARRFVQTLYLRDREEDPTLSEEVVDVVIYQRQPRAVYKTYTIGT